MRPVFHILSFIAVFGSCIPASAAVPEGYTLKFSDEFNASSIDTSKWSKFDYVSWNVADWRKYNSRDDALYVSNGNYLTLKAAYGDYTSQADQTGANDTYACAAITTQGKYSFQYGYVEVRAMFNCANGVWPAIWLLPNKGGNWPAGGEIDVMEHLNYDEKIYQTLHYTDNNGNRTSQSTTVSYTPRWDWHTFGMLWTEDCITMYLDGKETVSFSPDSSNWPFDDQGNEFYLICSNQIGGSWVGNTMTPSNINNNVDANGNVVDSTGKSFTLDYVRVYQLPEPAAFGLLAGLFALAHAQRRCKRRQ